MKLEVFEKNVGEPDKLIQLMYQEHNTCFDAVAYKQYNPETHEINDPVLRPNKEIWVPSPSGLTDASGKALMVQKTVYANKIPIPYQRLITSRTSAFTTGGKLTLKAKTNTDPEKRLLEKVMDIVYDNKMDFKNNQIVKSMCSQTEAAEIWFVKKDEETNTLELKCSVYEPADGFDLLPIFDPQRDLIAFGLGYKGKGEDGDIEHMDIYTDKSVMYHERSGNNGWQLIKKVDTKYGKIPVVYYNLKESIWKIVQPIIERLEYLVSNFGETNDYNGSPILFAEGKILGFSAKGETGKVIEAEAGAKLSYVSWDHAPESIKLEAEMLAEFIFTGVQMPNISFEQMKGLGDISGVAFDRIMIDAHLKAKDLQSGAYGIGIQRRYNFLISAVGNIYTTLSAGKTLKVTPEFGLFKIEDEVERIENAQKANGGLPVIDHIESIRMAGLSDEPEKTLTNIKLQEAARAKLEKANKPTPATPPIIVKKKVAEKTQK